MENASAAGLFEPVVEPRRLELADRVLVERPIRGPVSDPVGDLEGFPASGPVEPPAILLELAVRVRVAPLEEADHESPFLIQIHRLLRRGRAVTAHDSGPGPAASRTRAG